MARHLTELELELARTGEGDEDFSEHLASCGTCRERLQRLTRLGEQLALAPADIGDSSAQDAAVDAVIRARVAAIGRERAGRRTVRRVIWGAAAGAIAASLLLLLARPEVFHGDAAEVPRAALSDGDDINGDGRVDILDAFQAARELETGAPEAPRDEADVHRIAKLAVALDTGGDR
jgi:hypothetical protein